MKYTFACEHCGRQFRVQESAAGKRTRCPKCDELIVVPSPAEAAETAGAAQEEIPVAELVEEEQPKPTADADTLLSAYSASQDQTAGVGEKLKAGLGAVGDRLKARRIKGRIDGLESAIDNQLEKLGTMVLSEQPEELKVEQKVEQLADIQEQLSEREVTLESLKEAKGTGGLARDAKNEIKELRQSQRQVMVEIGKRAAEIRPEMTGAAACYTALDNLESMREQRRAELEELQERIGPLGEGAGSLARRFKSALARRKTLIVGVAAIVIIVLALLKFGLPVRFGFDPLVEYAAYIPTGTDAVAYVDVRAVTDTALYREVEGRINRADLPASAIRPEWINGAFICLTDDEEFVAALECDREIQIEDVVAEAPRLHTTVAGSGIYRAGYANYLAIPEPDVLVVADDDDLVEDVLRNVAAGRKGALYGSLKDDAAEMSGADIWFAGNADLYGSVVREVAPRTPLGMGFQPPSGVQGFCTRVDLGATYELWSRATYASEQDCRTAERQALNMIQTVRGLIRSGSEDVPAEFRDLAGVAETILDRLEISRSGRSLIQEFSIGEDFLVDLIRRATAASFLRMRGPHRIENAMSNVANTLGNAT